MSDISKGEPITHRTAQQQALYYGGELGDADQCLRKIANGIWEISDVLHELLKYLQP